MKRNEIQSLIDQVMKSENCTEDFNVVFTFHPDGKMEGAEAFINIIKQKGCKTYADGVMLFLNRKVFTKTGRRSTAYQKFVVLHEMGHIFTQSCKHSRREYRAQKWAHDKAVEFGMKQVANMSKEVTEYWKCFSKGNRYYRAYLIAKKQNFI